VLDLRDFVDRVKDRIPIETVVGRRVQLSTKSGRLWGLCPFHPEKTPSFSVRPDVGRFHCFGCGKSGDALNFLQEAEGLSFMEALERLAEEAGMELPSFSSAKQDPAKSDRRKKAREALSMARSLYAESLQGPSGAAARKYLGERSLAEETLKAFSVGWAPNESDWLVRALIGKGFDREALSEAGLCLEDSSNKPVDRFRERVMFPVLERGERTVGFGGRFLPGSWADENNRGKYINSPEGPLFPKRRILYGIHLLPDGLRANEDAPIVVTEGYLDVMMLHQAGMRTCVAALGTALTADHARLLRRFDRKVVLLMDADEAGQRATLRGARILVEEGVACEIASLPEGADPADLVARGEEGELFQRIANAEDIIKWRLSSWSRKVGQMGPADKDRVAREMAEWVNSAASPVLAETWSREVCDRLDIGEQAFRALCRQGSSSSLPAPVHHQPSISDSGGTLERNEREIAVAVLLDPSLLSRNQETLQGIQEDLEDSFASRVLAWCLERRAAQEQSGLDEALASFSEPEISLWLSGLRDLPLEEPARALASALEALPENRRKSQRNPQDPLDDEALRGFRRPVRISMKVSDRTTQSTTNPAEKE